MPRQSVRFARCLVLFGLCVALHPQTQFFTGYAVLTADSGASAPVGSALFAYTVGGTVVSQAGAAAVEPIPRGRIFVDQAGTQTGIALVNPSGESASVSLVVRDADGREVDRSQTTLAAGNHRAQFVREIFPGLAAGFTGSLTFESSRSLAAVTLRETRNARNEPVYGTLPVVDLASPLGAEPVLFPQIAAGGGYLTQIILINPSDLPLTGRIGFTDSGGNPLPLRLAQSVASEFSYRVAAQGTFRATFEGLSDLAIGYARVSPDAGSKAPSGTAVFQYVDGGAVVTEAGVAAASATTSARLYVDNSDAYSGVALANPSDQPAEVAFALLDRYGALQENATRTLPPQGHLAVFVHELFPSLGDRYTGLLEISSSGKLAPISLKLVVNDRGDLILTTLPVADLANPRSAATLVFPHIAIGEGFSTRLILINAASDRRATGMLSFTQSNGSPGTLPLGGVTGSRFSYDVAASGGRQLLPGVSATVASIAIIDPVSNRITTEVAVNQGKSVRPRLAVVDTAGAYRDDLDLTFSSLSTDVATVDGTGNVTGIAAGFSTLAIGSGGVLTAGTVTVTSVQSGASGYDVAGLAQDLGRRLYLTQPGEHTILRADDLQSAPSVYAGVRGTSGLKNDLRLQSWFREPALLAYNQSDGRLYVADSSNHVIRRVDASPDGKVETLAGTGEPGSRDGPLTDAAFRAPQGVALDDRGYLWIVDSGNHTVRRVDLASGVVATVAGKAGASGSADGTGEQARFNGPIGIAVEPEPLAERLERERLGEPPPPVRVIVADTGNGTIRRVSESGSVETLRAAPASGAAANRGARRFAEAPALLFRSPTGVAVDSSGNVHVTEPKEGRIRTILESGEVVSAAQSGSFVNPKGILVTSDGRIVATDASRTAAEIAYGEPRITSVSPQTIPNKAGARVTVKGKNFVPGSRILIGNVRIRDAEVKDTETISLVVPALASGLTVLTVQNRGGIAQSAITIEPATLDETPAGHVTTIAGGSTFAGEGTRATTAAIGAPRSIALDAAGNLFIADADNNRLRRVSASTGILTTVAGTGDPGSSGDNGLAILASLHSPRGVTVAPSGDVYVSDTLNHRVRRIHRGTGVITTVAGTGEAGSSGDGGPATGARLSSPHGLAIDASGNLFIADSGNHKIRKISAQGGTITTAAGTGESGLGEDNVPAAQSSLFEPRAVAIDRDGALFIADSRNNKVRKVDARTGRITTVAGTGTASFSGDGGDATRATLSFPAGVALGLAGDLYVADTNNHRIRRVSLASGVITTFAGSSDLSLSAPREIVVEPSGSLFVAESGRRRVRRFSLATGIGVTVAGNGESGFSGDGGPATSASLGPREIAVDSAGNVFVADTGFHRIRRIAALTGIITTVAGNGNAGFSGDGQSAAGASLNGPEGVALDLQGNLLISDTDNHRIRRVSGATGNITTIAGDGRSGSSGDGGAATLASLNSPRGIAVDLLGNLFVADALNHRIRKVSASTGTISTVAGTGSAGFSGDGGPASAAALNSPRGVAVDREGTLYVADTLNHRIRRVDADTAVITTIAGTGSKGFAGDGGPAAAASLNEPRDVFVDPAGNILVADTSNFRVRRIDAATRILATVAGGGSMSATGDNELATRASLRIARALVLDRAGNLLIVETGLSRIRAVRAPLP